MASLQIPEHLEEELQIAAEFSGCTKEEIAAQILAAHLEDQSLPLSAFSEAQLARIKDSIGQVQRGDVVTEEQIDRKFEAWFAKRTNG
jgi:predicted transcriptional regulator